MYYETFNEKIKAEKNHKKAQLNLIKVNHIISEITKNISNS